MDLTGRRVLVALDDEADDEFSGVLEGTGAIVMRAHSAGEALMTVVGASPDVVVVDLGLKGKDGLTLVRRMRELEVAKGGRVPAATVGPELLVGEDEDRWREAGAQAHLARPYDPVELLAVVGNLAGRLVERRRGSRDH